jgi:hypothetical protein
MHRARRIESGKTELAAGRTMMGAGRSGSGAGEPEEGPGDRKSVPGKDDQGWDGVDKVRAAANKRREKLIRVGRRR